MTSELIVLYLVTSLLTLTNQFGHSANKTLKRAMKNGCSQNITVNWWNFPPYIYKDGTGTKGVFKTIVESLIKDCCGDQTIFMYTEPQTSAESVKKHLLKSDISLPFFVGMNIKELEHRPFFPVIESPGLIFLRGITTKKKNDLGTAVLNTAFEAWPVLILTLIMAAISGIVIWALEYVLNSDEFPTSFLHGSWEGFWWAFVSMTTVGYGDKAPKSTLGRIFTFCWVLIGLVIISIFTATVTTSLTALSLSNHIALYGKNLAALKRAEEFSYGVRNNNNMELTNTIDEFVYLLKNRIDDEEKPIYGGLLDAYRAGHEQEKLSKKNGVEFGTVVNHQFVYGFVVSNNLMNTSLHVCLRRMLSLNEDKITSNIQQNMTPLAKPVKSSADETSSSLFDAKSEMFRHTIYACIGIICTLCLVGFLWEYFFWRPKIYNSMQTTKTTDEVETIDTTPTTPTTESYEDVISNECKLFEETMIDEVLSFYRAFQTQLDTIKGRERADKQTDIELSTLHLCHKDGFR